MHLRGRLPGHRHPRLRRGGAHRAAQRGVDRRCAGAGGAQAPHPRDGLDGARRRRLLVLADGALAVRPGARGDPRGRARRPGHGHRRRPSPAGRVRHRRRGRRPVRRAARPTTCGSSRPDDFGFIAAIDGLVTAVVGGSTMFLGPLLGSGFQTMIPEIQRALGVEAGWIRPFLASVLLLVVILFLPGGLASLHPAAHAHAGAPARDDDGPPAHLATRRHPAPGEVVATLAGLGKEYGGVHAVRERRPGGPQRRGRRPDRSERRGQDHAGQHDQRARAAELGQRHGARRDRSAARRCTSWRRPA